MCSGSSTSATIASVNAPSNQLHHLSYDNAAYAGLDISTACHHPSLLEESMTSTQTSMAGRDLEAAPKLDGLIQSSEMAARGVRWMLYDDEFRRLNNGNPATPWGELHTELYLRGYKTNTDKSARRTDLFRLSRIANNKQECAGRLRITRVFAENVIVPFDTVAQDVKGITQSTDAGLGDHRISLPTPIQIEKLTECLVGYHQNEKLALLQGLKQGF